MIDWRHGASRCVEAEPQTEGQLKSRKRARRPTAGPAPAIQECICKMQTPGCWWRRRGETAPRGGTLVTFSSTVSVRLRVSERTVFRVAVGPRRRWADTGCLVAFCISRVVRVQMRISIWNPAPRRHRADKASLGRLARDYRITPRPSITIITPGARSWQMSLTLCLCISASVCVLHSNPPTFNVSLLQQDRRKRKGCLTLLTTTSKRTKILFPPVLTSAPTATLPISLSSPCARCGALRPPKQPNP